MPITSLSQRRISLIHATSTFTVVVCMLAACGGAPARSAEDTNAELEAARIKLATGITAILAQVAIPQSECDAFNTCMWASLRADLSDDELFGQVDKAKLDKSIMASQVNCSPKIGQASLAAGLRTTCMKAWSLPGYCDCLMTHLAEPTPITWAVLATHDLDKRDAPAKVACADQVPDAQLRAAALCWPASSADPRGRCGA
jgi:hypothetical protein